MDEVRGMAKRILEHVRRQPPGAEELELIKGLAEDWRELMKVRADAIRALDDMERARRYAADRLESMSGLSLDEALSMSEHDLLRAALRHSMAAPLEAEIEAIAARIESGGGGGWRGLLRRVGAG